MKPLVQLAGSLPLQGHVVDLRLIEPTDHKFVFDLRTSKALSEHLSPTKGTAQDQRAWIEAYKLREAQGLEYYFVVQTKAGDACGLVRLYEISKIQFTWGSIILKADRPRLAALETTVLSMSFGFDTLGCERAALDVRRSNTHAIAFYRRLGMQQVRVDETDLYFEIGRSEFSNRKADLIDAIRQG